MRSAPAHGSATWIAQAEVDARALPADSDVTLGVRPEHVQIADGPGANIVTGLVAFLEQLGEASYIYVRLAGGELVTVRAERPVERLDRRADPALLPAQLPAPVRRRRRRDAAHGAASTC